MSVIPENSGVKGGALPPIESIIDEVAAVVHDEWADSKIAAGIYSRKAEDGEELIRPFGMLSEAQKDMDRAVVRRVYAALSRVVVYTANSNKGGAA